MRTSRSRYLRVRRAVPAGAALAAALMLTACAGPPAQHASHLAVSRSSAVARPPAGSGTLCRETAEVSRLVVQRIDLDARDHLRFAVPARVVVASPGRVREVARGLCALPALTIVNCPIASAVVYRLDFYPARLGLAPVQVSPGGCAAVTGLGTPRRMATARFWHVLAAAMGVARGAGNSAGLLRGSAA